MHTRLQLKNECNKKRYLAKTCCYVTRWSAYVWVRSYGRTQMLGVNMFPGQKRRVLLVQHGERAQPVVGAAHDSRSRRDVSHT